MDEQVCRMCGKPIQIQIMKNTGLCCGLCAKAAAKAE